jgi:hypothetical protein
VPTLKTPTRPSAELAQFCPYEQYQPTNLIVGLREVVGEPSAEVFLSLWLPRGQGKPLQFGPRGKHYLRHRVKMPDRGGVHAYEAPGAFYSTVGNYCVSCQDSGTLRVACHQYLRYMAACSARVRAA